MPQPPNPIMQGLRSIRRDPAVFLLEILWRWSFAITAWLIVFGAGLLLLGKVHSDSLTRAFQSKDPRMIGTSLLFTWLLLGVKAIVAVIVVPLVIALIYACFVAPARRITARRLRGSEPVSFRSMLALQLLRGFAAWMAYLLLIGAIAMAVRFATNRSRYDPSAFYAISSPAITVVLVLWLVLNWYLSLAAIFGTKGQSFFGAFRAARQSVGRQRSDFAGSGLVFLFLRLVLLAAVLAIGGLTSGMMATAPESYAVLVMALALGYFVAADFLYVWRMAAYVALVSAGAEDVITELERSAPPTGAGESQN